MKMTYFACNINARVSSSWSIFFKTFFFNRNPPKGYTEESRKCAKSDDVIEEGLIWARNCCPGVRVRVVFHKTVRVCHVYCNFKVGFTCRITVIFGTLKDGSLLINTLASNICFSYRNMFQNGVDALSNIVDASLSKSSKFYLVRIIR